jgi:CBS-domain-containing membrane protein
MVANPVTVSPSTSSLQAIELMRTNRIGCLPVVEGGQLVGIVTSYDFLEATAKLFHQHLSNNTEVSRSLPSYIALELGEDSRAEST